ncbi:perlucin-like protein [Mytilus trossulus]|uniref:perlucin-like protein n=1 Tax=Mytilus trossulus TaxID=6551 RepID=UPI00300539FB
MVSFACPNRWLKYENKCYYFSDEEKTWDQARLTCEYNRSKLVEVGSSCENDFVKMTAAVYDKSYWLDGSDRQSEGSWMWVSSLTKFAFADWYATEPSNHAGENCFRITMHLDFQWGDALCSAQLRFICEKRSSN